jgi:hypothetical protein
VDPAEFTVKAAVVSTPAAPAQGEAANPPQQRALASAKWEASKSLRVEEDPRISLSDADRAARRDALTKVSQLSMGFSIAVRSITGLRTSLTQAQESWKRPGGGPRIPENVTKAADELLKKIDEIYPLLATLPDEQPGLGDAGPPLVARPATLTRRIARIMMGLESFTAAPTASTLEEIPVLQKEAREIGEKIQKLVTEDLANLNKLMREASIPYISMPFGGGGRGGRRGGAPQ